MRLRERRFRRSQIVDGQRVYIEPSIYEERELFHTQGTATSTIYADRMEMWDLAKYNECCRSVWGKYIARFYDLDSKDVEKFISLYIGKSVKLIAVYVNQGYNGYDYYRFDYSEV